MAGAVLLAALGYLLAQGLTDAMNYYLTVKQAVAQRPVLGNKDFRIQGTVVRGIRQQGRDLYFSITGGGLSVAVVSTGSPSQLFRAGMPVVLAGHWSGTVFESDQIMVQHGSSYVEAPARKAAGARKAAVAPKEDAGQTAAVGPEGRSAS